MAVSKYDENWEDEITVNDHAMNGVQASGCSVLGIGRGKFADNQYNIHPSIGKGRGRFPSVSNTEDNFRPEYGRDEKIAFGESTSSRENDSNLNSFNNNETFAERKGNGSRSGCYKCHQEGHIARDCPNVQESGGNSFSNNATFTERKGSGSRSGCFKCHLEGHIARDCPNVQENDSNPNSFSNNGTFTERKRSGSRGECYKCHLEGHIARDCPNVQENESSLNSFGHNARFTDRKGNDSRSGCYKCHEEGHIARDCPNVQENDSNVSCFRERKGTGSRNECYKCHEEGHIARDCPNAQNEEGKTTATGSFKKGGVCFNCQEEGHMSNQCEKPRAERRDENGEIKPPPVTYIPVEEDDDMLFKQGVAAGINFEAFDHVEVKASGSGEIPPKANNFQEMDLRELLIKNICQAGYKKPTPIQKHAVPIIMNGRDLMACAQTGSGKTAAFLLPILHKIILRLNEEKLDGSIVASPIALILCPTRELVMQTHSEARKFACHSILKICCAYGGVNRRYQGKFLEKGCHVLVATTGRLLDFLRKGEIVFTSLRYLVLDEADRMLDLGFKGDIDAALEHSSMPKKEDRQTLMFSATFSPNVQQLAKMYLNDYIFLVTGLVGAANTDVRQTFLEIEQSQKRDTLEGFIKDELEANANQKIMVFLETKRMADFIALYLGENGINTTSIHGDREQAQREEAIREFKSGKRNVLVATAVAARGLDIEGVGVVVNYDMPKDIDEYVHRIGRTGRVGNPGRAVSYFQSSNDAHLAKALVQQLMNAHQEVPDFLNRCSEADVGLCPRGRSRFGASDVRHIKTQEYPAAAAVGGPLQSNEVGPNDEEAWD